MIAGDHLGLLRLALGRQALDHESALRPDGDDHGVLDVLRLHESQHFGAEILAPIRPANAAAGDETHAQMHPFHARREDEDLEHGLGQGQLAQLLALDLEGQVFLELAAGAALVGIGAHRRRQGIPQRAQYPVLIRERHRLERSLQTPIEPRQGALPGRRHKRRVEAGLEQVGQEARDGRVVHQHLCNVSLAEGQAGLQQVAAIGAHDDHHAPRNASRQGQLIEAVVVHAPGPNRGERAFHFAFQRIELRHRGGLHQQFKILDPGTPAGGKFQLIGPLGDDLEPHVLQHGQQVRNRNGILIAEDLQEELVLAPRIGPVDVEVQTSRFLLDGFEK